MKIKQTHNLYNNLYNYCRWDEKDQPIWIDKAKELLENNPGLDLTYKDGILFGLAISNESIPMLKVLLDYYEQNNLQSEPDTIQYKVAKHKLVCIIQNEANAYDFSNEMQNLLASYLPIDDDQSDREKDFEEMISGQNFVYDPISYEQYIEKQEQEAALEAGYDNRSDFYKSLVHGKQYAPLTEDNLSKFTQEQEKKFSASDNFDIYSLSEESGSGAIGITGKDSIQYDISK